MAVDFNNARLADRYISVNWDVSELLAKKEEILQKDLLKIRLRVGV
jgi:hypothetical protein